MVATLFVESNFLLELVLQQEQYGACKQILALARAGRVELRLPVFCLMEPLFTLDGRRKTRKELNRGLTAELGQYMREEAGQENVPAILSALNTLLIERGEVQQNQLIAVINELLEVGMQLLPLDAPVWQQLPAILSETELQIGDALVYASIRHNLSAARPPGPTLLVTRDTDFREPIIKQQLEQAGCSLLFDFYAAAARIAAL